MQGEPSLLVARLLTYAWSCQRDIGKIEKDLAIVASAVRCQLPGLLHSWSLSVETKTATEFTRLHGCFVGW